MGRLDMSCEGRGQQVIIYLKDNLNSRTFVWILQDLDGKMGGEEEYISTYSHLFQGCLNSPCGP